MPNVTDRHSTFAATTVVRSSCQLRPMRNIRCMSQTTDQAEGGTLSSQSHFRAGQREALSRCPSLQNQNHLSCSASTAVKCQYCGLRHQVKQVEPLTALNWRLAAQLVIPFLPNCRLQPFNPAGCIAACPLDTAAIPCPVVSERCPPDVAGTPGYCGQSAR